MTLAPAARIDINKLSNREQTIVEVRGGIPFTMVGKALRGEVDRPISPLVTALCMVALRRSNPGVDDEVLWEAALDMSAEDLKEADAVDPPLPPPTTSG
jgi:hypothetical protein